MVEHRGKIVEEIVFTRVVAYQRNGKYINSGKAIGENSGKAIDLLTRGVQQRDYYRIRIRLIYARIENTHTKETRSPILLLCRSGFL